jgi:hypothetical protein
VTLPELRELALELRLIAGTRLTEQDARQVRSAADELAAIASALAKGGAIVGDYAAVPLIGDDATVRGVPIPPPPDLGGKHRRPLEAAL